VKPNAADLSSLRAEIDAWRATRLGRAHMPVHLWDAAVALVGPLPVTSVARELGLNRDRLSACVARRGASEPPRVSRPAAFVEVGVADMARICSRLPVSASRSRRQLLLSTAFAWCRALSEWPPNATGRACSRDMSQHWRPGPRDSATGKVKYFTAEPMSLRALVVDRSRDTRD
jgi:hypothetical protein